MKLHVKVTAYSSVVGGGLQLLDESGRARFVVMLVGTTEGITKAENDAIAKHLASVFGTVEIPDRGAQ